MSETLRTTLLSASAVMALVSGILVAGWNAAEPPFMPELEPPRFPEDGNDVVVVLFDGASWDGWVTRDGQPSRWELDNADGSIVVTPGAGDAISREQFGDVQLHVEFMCPLMDGASGQGRGNSGVYLHGLYEVQVLDSFGQPPLADGCGAIYGVAAPAVNASEPPEKWQAYDIFFRGPRFDEAGNVTEPPRITVVHNGALIHNNVEIPASTTAAAGTDMVARGPILLQDHGDAVRYRNIWARRLD